MDSPTSSPSAVQEPRHLLKQLEKNFAVFRDPVPLAIGIDKQIMAQLPDTERAVLRTALRMHTKSSRYLRAMAKATVRSNLDGSPADEITDIHRTHAATLLQERAKKEAEQRKAVRQAQEAQRKLDEAAKLRAEKLNQLAAKFSRSK